MGIKPELKKMSQISREYAPDLSPNKNNFHPQAYPKDKFIL